MFYRLILAILATFVFVFSNAYCEESSKDKEENFHFRKARFGMTMAEVKKSEKQKPIDEEEDSLTYQDEVMGIEVYTFYTFVNQQFFRGSYLINEEYQNENNHIDDYQKLKTALIKKYEKPVLDRENWRNPLYKDDPHKYGFAVSIGHLEYRAQWIKDIRGREVRINAVLTGENYEITSGVAYTDILLEKFYKEQQEQKEESKL